MSYKEEMEALRKSGFLNHTYIFSPSIGLHRTTIKNLHIKSINPDKLSSSCARYITDTKNYALTSDGIPFSSISKVRLEHVNEFKACGYYKPFDDAWTESVTLDSSPSDYLKLNSLSDFHSQLDSISSELDTKYGIIIDKDDATLKSAEIAAEFILQDPLADYSRVFHILKSLNNTASKIDTIKPDNGINRWQSCIFKKSCYELYVYDKTRELYETRKIALSENVIKMELRIPETYLYQTRLKYRLSELDQSDIQAVFLNAYKRLIYSPFHRWHKHYMDNLNQLVFEYRSKYKRWISELYKYCADAEANYTINLIDWQDILLCPCIKSLDKRTQSRIQKQLQTVFENTHFSANTYIRIEELFLAIYSCQSGNVPNILVNSNKAL